MATSRYGPSDGYSQAYPPPDYGEGQDYGPPDVYGEDQGYGDAGYDQDQAYGHGQPYGDDQGYGRGYGDPQAYDRGYGPPQAYPQAQPYARPYVGSPSSAPGPGYGQAVRDTTRARATAPARPTPKSRPNGIPAGACRRPRTSGPVRRRNLMTRSLPTSVTRPRLVVRPRATARIVTVLTIRGAQPRLPLRPGRRPRPADRTQAQAPGREQGAGRAEPYPPPTPYGWPPGHEATARVKTGAGRPGSLRRPGRLRRPGARPGQRPARPGRTPAKRATRRLPRRPPAPAQAAAAEDAGAEDAGADMLAPLPGQSPDQQQAIETADDLTAEALLHGKRQAPAGGWRRLLYKTSGGLIRPRESAEALRRRELIQRVRTPVAGGHHRVAVMSLKGGVGKTTTTVSLGSMLASLRGDRIIALDANPDRGTLSDKVRLETSATVRDLLNERSQIRRYADVRAFTSQAPSRLEVLASDRDPTVSVAFCEEDYYDAARVLEHYYSISLIDCGTGLLHSAMAGVLRMADQIILVSSPSVDGARSASATLDWLDAHAYGDLVRNAVVVLSMIRPRSKSTVDLDRLEHHFAGRCRAVARIPYDGASRRGC